MKVRSVHFDDNERPAEIDVRLTAAEAVFLAKLVGNMNDLEQDAVTANGARAGHGIYNALTLVANGFFDDGVDDWARYLSAAEA